MTYFKITICILFFFNSDINRESDLLGLKGSEKLIGSKGNCRDSLEIQDKVKQLKEFLALADKDLLYFSAFPRTYDEFISVFGFKRIDIWTNKYGVLYPPSSESPARDSET